MSMRSCQEDNIACTSNKAWIPLSKIMAIVFLVMHSTHDDEEALYNMKATLSMSDANLLT